MPFCLLQQPCNIDILQVILVSLGFDINFIFAKHIQQALEGRVSNSKDTYFCILNLEQCMEVFPVHNVQVYQIVARVLPMHLLLA